MVTYTLLRRGAISFRVPCILSAKRPETPLTELLLPIHQDTNAMKTDLWFLVVMALRRYRRTRMSQIYYALSKKLDGQKVALNVIQHFQTLYCPPLVLPF